MRIIRPEVFFRKKSVTFTISRSSEEWILVSPSGFTPCSAWCGGSPLKYPGLLNPTTTLIIPHMQDTLTRLWLHWQSTEPAKLPKQLQLSVEHQLYIPAPHLQITDLEMDALKLVLEYVDLVGKYHVDVSVNHLKGDVIAHIQFVADTNWQLQFPEPDFSISSAASNGLSSRRRRNALSLLMRVRGPYDGGIDYSLERLIKPAMDLLFDTPRYRLLRSDGSSQYNTLDQDLPLVIACSSEELTDSERASMAEAARPTLLAMIRHFDAEDGTRPLPKNTFVYGIHWGRRLLNIFVYFPFRKSSGTWEFCDALIAQQWLTFEDDYDNIGPINSRDDLFLDQWRLTVACFTVRTHVQHWESVPLNTPAVPLSEIDVNLASKTLAEKQFELMAAPTIVPRTDHPDRESIDPKSERRGQKFPSSLQAVVSRMKAHWRGRALYVPSEWVLPAELTIITREATWERSSLYIRNLSKLYLHAIRDDLLPLSKTDLEDNHVSSTYVGPDYIHSIHQPRSQFNWWLLHIDDRKANTEPYRFKVYDFLSMDAASWDNVNLFVSHVFAGFSAYAVRWKPSIRYPVPPAVITPSYVVDFALMIQTIPPTTEPMIARFQKMPLTVSSPGILVGVRPLDMSGDGSTVGSDELESLAHIMRPHLQVMAMHAQHPLPLLKDASDYVLEVPILFCTYLKRGFLHIVAFHFETKSTVNEPGSSSAYLVDSLPLTLACDTQGDLMDRMRILVALFTLQRHIVRLCSGSSERSWPQDLLDEEQQWIIEETGFATPNPSFGVPSDRGEEASWWYESAGSMDTENAGPCEDELEASEMKVKKWLGELIEDSDSCEPEPAVVKHEVGTTTVAAATGKCQ